MDGAYGFTKGINKRRRGTGEEDILKSTYQKKEDADVEEKKRKGSIVEGIRALLRNGGKEKDIKTKVGKRSTSRGEEGERRKLTNTKKEMREGLKVLWVDRGKVGREEREGR